MTNKLVLTFFTVFLVSSFYAQQNLNAYKYIIVPNKFDFLKTENQYRLNELGQFLFEKYGFTALMEGSEYPLDLKLDRCLALRSNVYREKSLFNTKLTIKLKDCNDKTVYTSKAGESREKEYKTAYNFALRDAFSSLKALNYRYDASKVKPKVNSNETLTNSNVEEIQRLKQELSKLQDKPVAPTVPKVKAQVAPKTTRTTKAEVLTTEAKVLYAQAIKNGYQLVDRTPKVVYKIKTTHLDNVFLVEGQSAIIYQKDGAWVVEYYNGEDLKQETLQLKF